MIIEVGDHLEYEGPSGVVPTCRYSGIVVFTGIDLIVVSDNSNEFVIYRPEWHRLEKFEAGRIRTVK